MNAPKEKIKIVVIVGPTASGKSDLAVETALRYYGEVISADSRQVYRGLDLGTGKITAAEMQGVPHHCLDIADPQERFTAMDWKNAAVKAIEDIRSRGKLPIICGGTGFYISALVDDLGFPEVEADTEEQKALEAKTVEELFEELKKLDPARAATIDLKNKRRLSRSILIARELGNVPVLEKKESAYAPIMIGVTMSSTELKKRIRARILARFEAGMIDEAKKVHADKPAGLGLSYERMDELGLEYRFLAQYLQNKMSFEVLIETLGIKIGQYAKRQKTWFKKDTRITWLEQPIRPEMVDELIK